MCVSQKVRTLLAQYKATFSKKGTGKGTGIYGFRGGKSAVNYSHKLDKLVSDELLKRTKREKRRSFRQPLSLYFHDQSDLSNFNAMILKNMKDLEKSPSLSDINSEGKVVFTEVETTSTLSEVVIFWKMSNPKNSVKLAEVEQELFASAPIICEELNQNCILVGKIPKIVFEQDKKMKSEQFFDLLHNLKVEDETGSEQKTSEMFDACSDLPENFETDESYSTPDPSQLKTNVLGFKRDKVLAQVRIF